MQPFKFPLAAVLRQRELEERLAHKAVAEKLEVVREIEGELRQLQHTSEEAGQWLREGRLQGPINLQTLAAHRRYVNSVAVVGREQMQRLVIARQAAEETRKHLAEAAKRRKAVEKLRDKQEAEWRKSRARREAKLADESATQRSYDALTGRSG